MLVIDQGGVKIGQVNFYKHVVRNLSFGYHFSTKFKVVTNFPIQVQQPKLSVKLEVVSARGHIPYLGTRF